MFKMKRLLQLTLIVLVLVWVLGSLAYAMPQPQKVNGEVVLSLEVGSGPGQVGFTPDGPEIFPLGTESFEIGKDGAIYLLDSTNRRIQCFDAAGNLRDIIPLQIRGVDLQMAGDNTFYVLDETRWHTQGRFEGKGPGYL